MRRSLHELDLGLKGELTITNDMLSGAVENVAYWDMVKEFPQITEEVNKGNLASREAYKQAKANRSIYIQQENDLQELLKYGK